MPDFPYSGPALSKSRFLAGLQCPLRLWYQCYNRELASPVTPAQQAIFDMGRQVGVLATGRFPCGRLIEEDHLHHLDSVKTTRSAMADPGVPALFEAGFFEDDVRVRVDILERLSGDAWSLIEVKSATGVKDEYHTDVAVQLRVLRQAGLQVPRTCLMHIDRGYVYDGRRLDLEQLFALADLTEIAEGLQDFVADELAGLKEMLSAAGPPAVEPSRHCHRPHTCEFWPHCTRNKPGDWIFYLSGITQERLETLAARGIERIGDIPDAVPLTAMQRRIRDCVAKEEATISAPLCDLLTAAAGPIHFLDFETVSAAVPRYAHTRPYQALPFQWSDHVLFADGSLEHRQYLCTEDKDPRSEFAETLFDALGDEGSVFVYTTYEKRIVKEIAEAMPRYRERVERLLPRFVDLYAIIRGHYYHPAFRGSFSIKKVLPALVPDMDYQHLAVQDGTQASSAYLEMIDPAAGEEKRAAIAEDLLTYCGQDTLAMVRVREALLNACAERTGR